MTDDSEERYEDQMEELTRIVDQIGRSDCPIDELESKVKRAAELIKSLRKRLRDTEMTVKEVLADLQPDAAAGKEED
ncbi:exodeoxyribonuclease VII small subunit [Candidatus Fermentibacteria bacterium]|nr:exodeoxyribonuclease VII small subunit [Candidatus Fermentibacteria bacterium]